MDADKLPKLNENKTEFFILGVSQQLKKVGNISIRIGEDIIHNVPAGKNLGMYLDTELKHTTHMTKLTSGSFNTLCNTACVWCHLDEETTKILVQALILSETDYGNGFVSRNTKVQNSKAKTNSEQVL